MKKVERVDALFEFLRVLLGIIIAFALCVVIIVIMSGSDAGEAVRNFMIGPFMTKRRFGHVMAKWAAYMLLELQWRNAHVDLMQQTVKV